ncbi:MAG: HD domain-containing protein [Planctomyces sp.]|nr:HD domain-containing protein [Planctomyces sp.]
MSDTQPVDQILTVFREKGHRHYGENVSELEHALQTAEFAHQFGEPDAVVLSCLLHDYGHMLHDLGEDIAQQGVDAQHEELGARLLTELFPPEIVEPVRLHVAAKRYLCWKEPAYIEGLSTSSQQSLELQGGPMSDSEAAQFEALPHFKAAVQVRKYDDMGKVPGMKTASVESYRDLIQRFLKSPPTR